MFFLDYLRFRWQIFKGCVMGCLFVIAAFMGLLLMISDACRSKKPDADAYYRGGLELLKEDDYKHAIWKFDTAIQLYPEHAKAYMSRGLAYARQGDANRAVQDYTKAIEIDPKYALAYLNRGVAHAGSGRYDAAIADYSRSIELDPKEALAYHNRGVVQAAVGRCAEAVADYTRALELDPKHVSTHRARALAHSLAGAEDLAIEDCNRAVQKDPKDSWGYYHRGFAFFRSGAYEKAEKDFHKSIEIAPDYDCAHVMVFLARSRRGEEARGGLAAYREGRKKVKEKNWTANLVLMFLGERTPEQCLAAATSDDREEGMERRLRAHFYAGQLHVLRGNATAARASFQKALAAGATWFCECPTAKAELKRLKAPGRTPTIFDLLRSGRR